MGMTPTTISVAKQMTAAYVPLGAVMVPEDVYQAYVDHSREIGTFGHGFTYGGHPLGCAIGVKAIEIYQRRDIVGHVRTLTPLFAGTHAAVERSSDGGRNSLLRACWAVSNWWRTRRPGAPSRRPKRSAHSFPNTLKATEPSCARWATPSRSAHQ